MGYEIRDTETLTFDAYPGLEVVVKVATTMAEFEAINALGEKGQGEQMDAAIRDFGDRFIESWNVTSRGEDLEPGGASLARLPLQMQLAIIAGWMELMRGPSAPLGDGSSDTSDLLEPSTGEPDGQ